jgi:uncharacterized protein (TIGR03437 family)
VAWSSGPGSTPSTSNVVDNAGNTYFEAGNARALATTGMVDMWYAKNSIAGATTVTITPNPSGTIGEAVIWEFAHADTVSPLDQSAVLNSQPSTSTPTGAAVATTAPGEVVVSVVIPGSTPSALHAGNPFTNDLLFSGAGWAHLFTSSVGGYAAQWDAASSSYASSTASFKASRNVTLTTPASVAITAGSTSATFNASTGSFSSNQSATVMATLNGQSQSATVSLVAPMLVSALACNPTSLGSGAGTACVVTLSQAAPAGGILVSLSSNNVLLPVPGSVTITAGSTTASFTATSGSITASQTAAVTASYNGSFQSVSIALVPSTQLNSLVCTQTGLMSSGGTTCTLTLSQTVGANTPISLGSNSTLLTVPASVTVPAGSNSTGFNATAGTIAADASGVITATLGTSSQIVTLALWSTPALSSLACSPTALKVGGASTCTVTLSKAAGAITVGLASSNPALNIPASVSVPQGAISATFTGLALSVPQGWVILTANWNGVNKSVIMTIAAASSSQSAASPQSITSSVRANSITCTPKMLPAGKSGLCQIDLDGVGAAGTAELQLSSSNDSIKLPATIATRPGQTSVQFQIDAAFSPTVESAEIAARLGVDVIQDTVTISMLRRLRLSTPGRRLVKYGTEVHFTVFSSDAGATLSVTSLPAGASFDATSGTFDWIPTEAQQGMYQVTFNALSPTGEVITGRVELEVDSGAPLITRVINAASQSQEAACSPGAIGRIEGKWLSGESTAASDASGSSLRLAGATVTVNGDAVRVLYASGTRVDFLCPAAVPGSQLQIVVETASGRSPASQTTARELAPGVFSIDGSDAGQGMVFHGDSTRLVMVRNYSYASQPARPGDVITLYATGMEGAAKASVRIGDTVVELNSITKVPGVPGLWLLSIRVPEGETGNQVGLSIDGRVSNGASSLSNQIRIAIEAAGR